MTKMPKIELCAVVPIPDEKYNQVPVAYIKLSEDIAHDIALERIQQYCEKNLEWAYRPIRFEFVTQYPRTKIGKIDYRALEKMAEAMKEELISK